MHGHQSVARLILKMHAWISSICKLDMEEIQVCIFKNTYVTTEFHIFLQMATFSISNDAIKQPTRRKAFQKKIGKVCFCFSNFISEPFNYVILNKTGHAKLNSVLLSDLISCYEWVIIVSATTRRKVLKNISIENQEDNCWTILINWKKNEYKRNINLLRTSSTLFSRPRPKIVPPPRSTGVHRLLPCPHFLASLQPSQIGKVVVKWLPKLKVKFHTQANGVAVLNRT